MATTALIARLLPALLAVEGTGIDWDYVHPASGARGRYQITAIWVAEVNQLRAGGPRWKPADAHNPAAARQIAEEGLTLLAELYRDREGREPGLRELAMMYRKGRLGYRSPAARAYWRRVEERLFY